MGIMLEVHAMNILDSFDSFVTVYILQCSDACIHARMFHNKALYMYT